MIRVAILEDNAADAAVLRDSLRRYEEKRRGKLSFEIEECGDCLEFLDNYQPNYDILFFDIEMPNLNGMKAAQKIYEKDKDVVMVFVTNLEKYAVQGYRVDAMGYLLKPFAYSRFAEIMDRSLRRLERRRAEEIVLLNGGTIVRVPVSNILYIEVIGHILTYRVCAEISEKSVLR